MSFGHDKVLWLGLALLPLLGLFLWATWRKRQALIRQFVQNKTLAQLTLGISASRQKLRRVLIFTAAGFLLLALARPQWGFTWEEASQRGRDIVVAIDTSRSMLAEDVQPNRLARAKLAALDLLQLGRFDRFGLVAFAGTAFLQCPLTFDDEAFRQSVQILEPGIIPQGGTAISQAIQSAREAYGKEAADNHKILILFTDGEDHEQEVISAVQRASTEGIRIFTVGVGTPAGELLRIKDERGNIGYLKDDAGNVVQSRLNEQLLQQIATEGDGFYMGLQGANAMEVLYQRGLAPLPTTERTTKLTKKLKEQFYWPLAVAIGLLIIEMFVPDQKRARKEKDQLTPGNARAAVALAFLIGAMPAAFASASKAQRHYKAGEYKSALSEYQELLAKSPNDPRLHYNAGASAFQAGKFDQAVKSFQAAAATPDLDLQQQSFYNLGNAEFRLGQGASDPKERGALWEQAVQHYEASLKLNANDPDAAYNRDLVRKLLEELKKQQEQPKSDNKGDQNKDDPGQKDEKEGDQEQPQQNNPSDQQQKEEQKNQEGQNNPSRQQGQDKSETPEQQKTPEERKRESEQSSDAQAQQSGGEKQSESQPPAGEGEGQQVQLGKMTPAQAKQLLDAQRGDEKALIFVPQGTKAGSPNRTLKDW